MAKKPADIAEQAYADHSTATPAPEKKKRQRKKPSLLELVQSLDANAIRERIAEIDNERAALKVFLDAAMARDKTANPFSVGSTERTDS
jgi:hypothetical protein